MVGGGLELEKGHSRNCEWRVCRLARARARRRRVSLFVRIGLLCPARPCHICTGTAGLTPPTSAPGLTAPCSSRERVSAWPQAARSTPARTHGRTNVCGCLCSAVSVCARARLCSAARLALIELLADACDDAQACKQRARDTSRMQRAAWQHPHHAVPCRTRTCMQHASQGYARSE